MNFKKIEKICESEENLSRVSSCLVLCRAASQAVPLQSEALQARQMESQARHGAEVLENKTKGKRKHLVNVSRCIKKPADKLIVLDLVTTSQS
jgi:hypothetical protein